MKWFDFRKKKTSALVGSPHAPLKSSAESSGPFPEPEAEIVVYGTQEDRRCKALRDLLDQSGYPYKDERVEEDFGTRAWLQRTTGDDALPKVFRANQYIGTYEDIQALLYNGQLDQVLSGKAAKEEEDKKRLRAQMTVDSIIQLLRDGESLVVNEDGAETETWLEPRGSPPKSCFTENLIPLKKWGQSSVVLWNATKKGKSL